MAERKRGAPTASAGSTSGAPPATTFIDYTATDALPITYYVLLHLRAMPSTPVTEGRQPLSASTISDEQENLIASTTTSSGSWTYVAESGTSNHNVLVVDSLHGDANYDKVVSTVRVVGSGPVPIVVAMAPSGSAGRRARRAQPPGRCDPCTYTGTHLHGQNNDPCGGARQPRRDGGDAELFGAVGRPLQRRHCHGNQHRHRHCDSHRRTAYARWRPAASSYGHKIVLPSSADA